MAIARFNASPPELIWMDLNMPVMDGYEATRRIRQLPGGNNIKILALTANALKAERERILETGCDDVFYKPYQLEDVLHAMEEHLGVKYKYAVDGPKVEALPAVIMLEAEDFKLLPQPLIEELLLAARSLDQRQLQLLIESIDPSQQQLRDGLTTLDFHFQFDEIIRLCELAQEAVVIQK